MTRSTNDHKDQSGHVGDSIAEFRQQAQSFFERDFSRLDELIGQLQQPLGQPEVSATNNAQQQQQSQHAPGPCRPDDATDTAASPPAGALKNAAGTASRRTGSPAVPETRQPPIALPPKTGPALTDQPTAEPHTNRLAELANSITDRIRAATENSRDS